MTLSAHLPSKARFSAHPRYGIYNLLVGLLGSNEADPSKARSADSALRPTGVSGAFWDPFEGDVYVREDLSLNTSTQSVISSYFSNLSVLLLPVGLIGFCVGLLSHFHILQNSDLLIFGGFGAFGASIALILFIDSLTGTQKKSFQMLKRIADDAGFALRVHTSEARLSHIRARVGEFFTLRFASAIPLVVEAEMWGTSRHNSLPLWIGLSLGQSTSIGSGPKAQTVGTHGRSFGKTLMFIVGYELERDTQVRVQLFPEFKTPLGPLDIDIKTESVQFNSKYNIRLSSDGGKPIAKHMSADLLRLLTPAFQDTLIGLADRYATRIILDGNTVFFAGYHNLVSHDQNELERMVRQTLDQCTLAAVSFKKYAE
ncbi:MAG: hypothetical protein AAF141_01610 [Pseudomonadota bacterium]